MLTQPQRKSYHSYVSGQFLSLTPNSAFPTSPHLIPSTSWVVLALAQLAQPRGHDVQEGRELVAEPIVGARDCPLSQSGAHFIFVHQNFYFLGLEQKKGVFCLLSSEKKVILLGSTRFNYVKIGSAVCFSS